MTDAIHIQTEVEDLARETIDALETLLEDPYDTAMKLAKTPIMQFTLTALFNFARHRDKPIPYTEACKRCGTFMVHLTTVRNIFAPVQELCAREQERITFIDAVGRMAQDW